MRRNYGSQPKRGLELRYHSLKDAVNELGSVKTISEVFTGFQRYLYAQNEAA